MSSRLDRLIVLLESGSSPAVRAAAAEQLGGMQAERADQLFHLLARVMPLLRHKSWDARAAAAQAIEQICRHVPPWNPVSGSADTESGVEDDDQWSLALVDLTTVVEQGKALTSSSGQEYNDEHLAGLSVAERLALMKKQIREKLGLEGFMNVDFVGTQDLDGGSAPGKHARDEAQVSDLVSRAKKIKREQAPTEKALSAREEKALRRQQRTVQNAARQASGLAVDAGALAGALAGPATATAGGPSVVVSYRGAAADDPDADDVDTDAAAVRWPFTRLCAFLRMDLFDSRWETRHGAALGLAAVLRRHAGGAGRRLGLDTAGNEAAHAAALEDLAVRLLCTLALDRFSDFLSDGMVCPVRETAAQALAVICAAADATLATRIAAEGLSQLILYAGGAIESRDEWAVRFSGMLGLRYWIAVRQDLVEPVVVCGNGGRLWKALSAGLADASDDIRSVTATALLPVSGQLPAHVDEATLVAEIVRPLWACLGDLDDLSSAAQPMLQLLAALWRDPELTRAFVARELRDSSGCASQLLLRFVPFLRHSSSAVRLAVLQSLGVLASSVCGANGQVGAAAAGASVGLLQLLYQNFVLEDSHAIQDATLEAWGVLLGQLERDSQAPPLLSARLLGWFELAVVPVGRPLTALSLEPPYSIRGRDQALARGDASIFRSEDLFRGRLLAARALGQALAVVCSTIDNANVKGTPNAPHEAAQRLFAAYLESGMIAHRVVCGFAVLEWATWVTARGQCPSENPLGASWITQLSALVAQEDARRGIALFTDLVPFLARVRSAVVSLRSDAGNLVNLPEVEPLPGTTAESAVFSFEVAQQWVTERLAAAGSIPGGTLAATHAALVLTWRDQKAQAQMLVTRYAAAFAAALLALSGALPERLTPVIRPLAAAVRLERDALLQSRMCSEQAALVARLVDAGKDPVADKVVRNLLALIPGVLSVRWARLEAQVSLGSILEGEAGIWALAHPDEALGFASEATDASSQAAEASSQATAAVAGAEDAASSKRGRGPRRTSTTASDEKTTGKAPETLILTADTDELALEAAAVAARGGTAFVKALAQRFGVELLERVPRVWTAASAALDANLPAREQCEALLTASVLVPAACVAGDAVQTRMQSLLGRLCQLLEAPRTVVRHCAAAALAAATAAAPAAAMELILERVVPLLGRADTPRARLGAASFMLRLTAVLDVEILPWLVFFIVPVLSRMSDTEPDVRFACTHVFAQLVKLMPLEAGTPDPPQMAPALVARKRDERRFVAQLVGGSGAVEPFEIPVPIRATLRPYQREGVSWLAFLNRYGLHGILCDDMGLGKTLQTICMLASDRAMATKPLPSLVVCPPTLTGHWVHEIHQYAESLTAQVYAGPQRSSVLVEADADRVHVIVAPYSVVARDVEILQSRAWNYVVLDEGHVIKNPRTKLAQAVKSLPSLKRLILSGTPVQNHVFELWSLFDFLMPGFLGTQTEFNARFARPIRASRDARARSKEYEAGARALDALHKQVLPFLLRRMKEDVLDDLPPKIIQDYYCELSPLQRQLYEHASKRVESGGASSEHVFQSLQYLRKLCDHPALVLGESHPLFKQVNRELIASNSHLHDLKHAPKLLALRDILLACGIGVAPSAAAGDDADDEPASANHRVLVFAQFKAILDTIERDLFAREMPNVTFRRLDGSVDAARRHDIVVEFNRDPSIDVLLLTTHVGGLGLNLTGADTVVFVEHDWNPAKDVQAMDRAHRLGQRRVVNVYRLITRGTIEEKIMGLQQFKLHTANAIVNQDNAAVESMATDRILDLFGGSAEEAQPADSQADSDKRLSAKQVLEQLEREGTWEDDYNSFQTDAFLASLG